MKKIILSIVFLAFISQIHAQDTLAHSLVNGFTFRNIGPAVASGRIVDIAVNPQDNSEYYLAVACGGVWKTNNSGNTYKPVFDNYGTFSIGCVSLDPSNPHTVWVGTGENNNQRSVSYGDGIYRSDDGGGSFTNMGLKNSEHIGMIKVDPRNSNVIFAAAYGPLWKEGGDRGVFKSVDGGKTWNNVLKVSENTGCNEIHFDPRNPDVLYASFHQRRRHEWTYLGGGPESAIYKSTDGGITWNKIMSGMPAGDIGRITLAVSPVNADIIYAMLEATTGGGFYKSINRGASWEKQNEFSTAGNYYQEIMPDPVDVNKVYVMDTYLKFTKDGGKTFSNVGEKFKHVDNHAIWVDPSDTRHFLVGCDGGLYETWDAGSNYSFKPNLPITQFYRVSVDNAFPFYNVYGGTQDNNTLGGPSGSTSISGVTNADWFVTVGGDGFKSQIDPNDPNIVYSQWQYGGLIRYDRKNGESLDIKPAELEGEPALRWNWDAPLIISNHSSSRLYFAANKVYRTDDRGNTWKLISPDLTRQTDRNKLPIMGRLWSMDAVAKNQSTSIYGNIVSFTESPKNENILYAGTDDGLIQSTEDGGTTWVKSSVPAGVPANTYVSCLLASQHNDGVLYASFDNHRMGDFKPYIYKSIDKGKTWENISVNLPKNGSVKSIAEDFIKSDLLFVGTEFGLFMSYNGGKNWVPMKSGLPPAAIKDIAIQKRECDLVLATFGRGFAILDNYAPLRDLTKDNLNKDAHIFPVKKSLMYIKRRPLGSRGKGHQGESFYLAPNPAFGAVITYHLKNEYKTIKQLRQDREKAALKANKTIYYPTADSIRLEDQEEAPYLLFIISDDLGNEVRRIKTAATKGINRVVWDLRFASTNPINYPTPDLSNPYNEPDNGHFVVPGKYNVKLFVVKNGIQSSLNASATIECEALNASSLPLVDKSDLASFGADVAEFRRNVSAASEYFGEVNQRLASIKKATQNTAASESISKTLMALNEKSTKLTIKLYGDGSLARREFETLPGIYSRIENVIGNLLSTTSAPTTTMKDQFNLVSKLFDSWVNDFQQLDLELKNLEEQLDELKVPYTPGRTFFFKN